jgi:hypothetical protein
MLVCYYTNKETFEISQFSSHVIEKLLKLSKANLSTPLVQKLCRCIKTLSARGKITETQLINNTFTVLVYLLPSTSAGSHERHLICPLIRIHNTVLTIHTNIYIIPKGTLLRPFVSTPLTNLDNFLIFTV